LRSRWGQGCAGKRLLQKKLVRKINNQEWVAAPVRGAHAPVKDALARPITAGGFVDGAPIVFADITHKAGLDKFHHRSGSYEKNSILETPGSGVALKPRRMHF
jgi:hypothetical protein